MRYREELRMRRRCARARLACERRCAGDWTPTFTEADRERFTVSASGVVVIPKGARVEA